MEELESVQKNNYDESAIIHLEDMEHLRLRPTMYIGKLGDGSSHDDGIYVLIKEVIDNAIDEFTMGYGKTIEVNVDFAEKKVRIRDYGRGPFAFNIHHATTKNQNFRTTLWTGNYLQLTLMSIPVNSDIGVEMHPDVDQFVRVECGRAKVYFGNSRNSLREVEVVNENYAILIPAGTWHNIVNIGICPLKVYSLYAPPQHPFGTVHKTKADAEH